VNNNHEPAAVRVFRVVRRDWAGLLQGTAPRFHTEKKAERWVRLLRRDPAVTETRIVAVVLRPLLPLPGEPAP
jgi:hypothetical protein